MTEHSKGWVEMNLHTRLSSQRAPYILNEEEAQFVLGLYDERDALKRVIKRRLLEDLSDTDAHAPLPSHGIWIEYKSGHVRQMRTSLTVLEAITGRDRVYSKLREMQDRGAIISAKRVGVSGGPALWR